MSSTQSSHQNAVTLRSSPPLAACFSEKNLARFALALATLLWQAFVAPIEIASDLPTAPVNHAKRTVPGAGYPKAGLPCWDVPLPKKTP